MLLLLLLYTVIHSVITVTIITPDAKINARSKECIKPYKFSLLTHLYINSEDNYLNTTKSNNWLCADLFFFSSDLLPVS